MPETSKSFTIHLNDDPDALVTKAQQAAGIYNATLTGDANSGTFVGNGVEGDYEIKGQILTVTITRKPAFVPWSLVESIVKGLFT